MSKLRPSELDFLRRWQHPEKARATVTKRPIKTRFRKPEPPSPDDIVLRQVPDELTMPMLEATMHHPELATMLLDAARKREGLANE